MAIKAKVEAKGDLGDKAEEVEEEEIEGIDLIEEIEEIEGKEDKEDKGEIEGKEVKEVMVREDEEMDKRKNMLINRLVNNPRQRNYSNKGSPSKKIVILYSNAGQYTKKQSK